MRQWRKVCPPMDSGFRIQSSRLDHCQAKPRVSEFRLAFGSVSLHIMKTDFSVMIAGERKLLSLQRPGAKAKDDARESASNDCRHESGIESRNAAMLQWIARDSGGLSPGIECTPGVQSGEPCIVRTRFPVWLLAQAKILGSSEADIFRAYPTLRAEDLANAWAYYRASKVEIDRQIVENETA